MRWFIALLLFTSTVLADGYDRRIIFRNESSYSIERIYASNVGRSTWGIDRLGSSILYPGESGWVDLDDNTGYCSFDFKLVTSVGTLYRSGVNVCSVEVYTVYD